MRKIQFFSLTRRWLQLSALVGVLMLGWFLITILRWIKGDSWYQNQKNVLLGSNLGINPARADVPGGGGGDGSGGSWSTPFLAVWDGKEYKIENDFLFGKPRSYFADFSEGKRNYESGWVSPDLYKIQSPFKPKEGKLSFQIREIEPEESFINGLTLLRVIHPVGSEVIVDSDYRKFHVFERKSLEENLIAPKILLNKAGQDLIHLTNINAFWKDSDGEVLFDKDDYVDLAFNNLERGAKYLLALKSRYRVWMMGENPEPLVQARSIIQSFIDSRILKPAAVAGLMIFWPWLTGSTGWLTNMLFISSCGSAGSDGSAGSSAGDGQAPGGRCLQVFYKSGYGGHSYTGTVEPRGWHYSLECLELPRESVLNSGEMHLRILATERHYVGFIGLIKELTEIPSKLETLGIRYAYHHRLRGEVTDLLRYQSSGYLQTIPGDVVDIEFDTSKIDLTNSEQETYLIRAAGFYTYLSPESKKLAGNWEERICSEAKERLAIFQREV